MVGGAPCSCRGVREPSQVPVGNPHPSKEPPRQQPESFKAGERTKTRTPSGNVRGDRTGRGSSGRARGPRRPRPRLATGSDSF